MRKSWKQKALEALRASVCARVCPCVSVCVHGGDSGGLEVQSVEQPIRT